ncbi:hypothetical protein GJ688_15450 [Heliobacillus mobilis]|uniref:Uncharacterized protein n=1 Tax=Heliobacterium mobile TaxID=28064 RepID=A0A6I3SNT4_HELMO|nr:hypothetical protein [Heliobacterium mobile]MTV50365.1 hypothetical protein [Heliobacterium mobile]
MNNNLQYPFKRNHYYLGKLLRVQDFKVEQKYFNDKRRLLNRLLFGTGIVTGLRVDRMDAEHVTITPGVALDGQGREIVVHSRETLNLFSLESYKRGKVGSKDIYLCIKYKQELDEPGALVDYPIAQEKDGYNRVVESYEFLIREEVQSLTGFELSDLYENVCVIYEAPGIRVYQKTPRYVHPGETFDVVLGIEKTVEKSTVSINYTLTSEDLVPVSPEDWVITYEEPSGGFRNEKRIKFTAKEKLKESARLHIKDETLKVKVGDRLVQTVNGCYNQIGLTRQPDEQALEEYYKRTLDQWININDPYVYLAKINVIEIGSQYFIDKVEQAPFVERVYSNALLRRMIHAQKGSPPDRAFRAETKVLPADQSPYLDVIEDRTNHTCTFSLGLPACERGDTEIRTGRVNIPLETEKRGGDKWFVVTERIIYSDEIAHGLGKGEIWLQVGLEDAAEITEKEETRAERRMYFGTPGLFANSIYDSPLQTVSTGIVAFPERGTFVIAVKVPAALNREVISLRWWAYKKTAAAPSVNSPEAAAARDGYFSISGS